ncbi:MAG: hypothetical protein R3A78_03000 [Polyangiales bacterium]
MAIGRSFAAWRFVVAFVCVGGAFTATRAAAQGPPDPLVYPPRPRLLVVRPPAEPLVIPPVRLAPPRASQRVADEGPRLLVGAGFDALVFVNDTMDGAAPSLLLALGVQVDRMAFLVRSNIAPSQGMLSSGANAALYTVGASFEYALLRNARLMPSFDVGLEYATLDPALGDHASAFGATGGVSLTLGVPLGEVSLGLGLRVGAHLPFAPVSGEDASFARMLDAGAFATLAF